MRPPTRAELDGLIDGFVRDEIYYREALALGLDRDDPVVRQRMRQKLELLLEDLSDTAEPSDAELERFLAEHAERFALPPRKMTLRWRLFLPGFEVHSKPMKAVKLPGWLCASAASVMRDQAVR